jgi:hypothetical protein
MLLFAVIVTTLTTALATSGRSDSMEIGEGIIRKSSPRSVPETLDRLETLLKSKGVQVFARIDHAGEAARVGLSMPRRRSSSSAIRAQGPR